MKNPMDMHFYDANMTCPKCGSDFHSEHYEQAVRERDGFKCAAEIMKQERDEARAERDQLEIDMAKPIIELAAAEARIDILDAELERCHLPLLDERLALERARSQKLVEAARKVQAWVRRDALAIENPEHPLLILEEALAEYESQGRDLHPDQNAAKSNPGENDSDVDHPTKAGKDE